MHANEFTLSQNPKSYCPRERIKPEEDVKTALILEPRTVRHPVKLSPWTEKRYQRRAGAIHVKPHPLQSVAPSSPALRPPKLTESLMMA